MKTIPACILMFTCLWIHTAQAQQPDGATAKTEPSPPEESKPYIPPVLKSPDGEAYFPAGRESYYTKYYRAAKLPSLLTKREEKGKVRFRLAILPSFTKPIFLTYSRSAEEAVIEVTRLDLLVNQANQLEPGKVELSGKVSVGKRIARNLEADVIQPEIRNPLSHLTEEQKCLYGGLDGCTWILEVSTDKDYTMEDIWSPGAEQLLPQKVLDEYKLPKVDTQWFQKFGESLLEITDMKIPGQHLLMLKDDS